MKFLIRSMLMILLLGGITCSYADDLEDDLAYQRAYGEFMTTMESFEKFNFENPITREQAARFLVMGAQALDIDLTGSQNCQFEDSATADPSLREFIDQGCFLGIFKAQSLFNPRQVLTREQAELTIARLLKGYDEVATTASTKNITDFAAARQILKSEGVVKYDIDPLSPVLRGHLLLMLYRLPYANTTGVLASPNGGALLPRVPGNLEEENND